MRPNGETLEVPEFLLEHEEIAYPWALPEQESGQSLKLMDADFYRRYEIVPGEAYLFLRTSHDLGWVPETEIRRLLGALGTKRPTRFPVALSGLRAISDGLGGRTLERHAGCVLVIPREMWDESPKDMRTMFHNLARIEGVDYEVSALGGSAYWLFKDAPSLTRVELE